MARRTAGRSASELAPEPAQSAQAAGLRHVSAAKPGISRRRAGGGHAYTAPDGSPVRDPATLARIRALAIPPAWSEVWICPDPKGHIQATGRDARGRKQYRYHASWHEIRHETKFGRMLAFSAALPAIRRALDIDLALPGLPRRKVLATVVRLLECTQIRIGNDEYARNNRSYGLTTLKNRHVEVSGSTLRFEFRGKSGKTHAVDVADRRLARIVARCQAIPGEELFQYLDDAEERQTIDSGDVNDYIREIAGDEFTAKDFRTWAGTVLACEALLELGVPATRKEERANILAAIDRVAGQLNNTRAVCRRYYVHPEVLAAYGEGVLGGILNGTRAGLGKGRKDGLKMLERRVTKLLRQRAG
jgi:DNA topoisomerase-1